MSTLIAVDHFKSAFRRLLEETFEHVHGYYLDGGTSLFETLAGVSAADASRPINGRCATLAAQVKHVAFYIDLLDRSVRSGQDEPVDWGEIWRTTGAVTPAEWDALTAGLRASHGRLLALVDATPDWNQPEVLAGTLGVLAHTAYHLGEIRQALCFLNSRS